MRDINPELLGVGEVTKDDLKQYCLGRFRLDPVINEIVQIIRYATASEVRILMHEGLISSEQLRLVRAMIANENN